MRNQKDLLKSKYSLNLVFPIGIIVDDKDRMSTGANVCVDGEPFRMLSFGYNILVSGGKGVFVEDDNDQTGNYYNDVLGLTC